MTAIPFTKMHGIGNDYVYVDGFTATVRDPAALARAVSDRHVGIGSDGLIMILPPGDATGADVRMRMFNADGSEAEMCGNGVRCVCKYAYDRGLSRARPMRIETGGGVLVLDYETGADGAVQEVTVDMGAPVLEPARIPVALPAPAEGPVLDLPLAAAGAVAAARWLDGCGLEGGMTCVSMGNPHAVLFCRDASAVPLERVGPALETLPLFPARVNVHVVEPRGPGEVTMRSWERGSGITLACGTGASAVCVAGVLTGRTETAILAHLPGGDLRLRWDGGDAHVFMTGPATEVFTGVWPG